MRSIVGVGMTPPKVLGTPKPESSVMMSRTLGASLGGTMRGAHQALDCRASSLITPPNFGSGAGQLLAADGGGGAGRTRRAGGFDFGPGGDDRGGDGGRGDPEAKTLVLEYSLVFLHSIALSICCLIAELIQSVRRARHPRPEPAAAVQHRRRRWLFILWFGWFQSVRLSGLVTSGLVGQFEASPRSNLAP